MLIRDVAGVDNTVVGCTIAQNSAYEGGGLLSFSNFSTSSSLVDGNSAVEGAGIAVRTSCQVVGATLSGTTVRGNEACTMCWRKKGGGVFGSVAPRGNMG